MRKIFLSLLTLLVLPSTIPSPAHASGNYTTPEYSGPSARIDSGGMGGTEPMVTRSAPIGPFSSSSGFETHVERRGEKITREMDRRRDESIRRNERHVLESKRLKNRNIKTNE